MKLQSIFQSFLSTSALVLSVVTASSSANANMQNFDSDKLTDLMMPTYFEEFAEAINFEQLTQNTAYKLSTAEVGDKCVALMNKDMMAGHVGQSLSQVFLDNSTELNDLVAGGSVKNSYCPYYSRMTDKEKSIVWVFILTSMAHFESTCSTTAAAKGPNGTAYGYYQLHHGQEHKYDGGKGFCQKGDAAKPLASSKCALGMLEKQFETRDGELFSNSSYWDVLRPNGAAQKAGVIRKALMRSTLCNPRTI